MIFVSIHVNLFLFMARFCLPKFVHMQEKTYFYVVYRIA
jgi:hypothetical protein